MLVKQPPTSREPPSPILAPAVLSYPPFPSPAPNPPWPGPAPAVSGPGYWGAPIPPFDPTAAPVPVSAAVSSYLATVRAALLATATPYQRDMHSFVGVEAGLQLLLDQRYSYAPRGYGAPDRAPLNPAAVSAPPSRSPSQPPARVPLDRDTTAADQVARKARLQVAINDQVQAFYIDQVTDALVHYDGLSLNQGGVGVTKGIGQ